MAAPPPPSLPGKAPDMATFEEVLGKEKVQEIAKRGRPSPPIDTKGVLWKLQGFGLSLLLQAGFDRTRILIQTQGHWAHAPEPRTQYAGAREFLTRAAREEGMASLLRGFTPMVLNTLLAIPVKHFANVPSMIITSMLMPKKPAPPNSGAVPQPPPHAPSNAPIRQPGSPMVPPPSLQLGPNGLPTLAQDKGSAESAPLLHRIHANLLRYGTMFSFVSLSTLVLNAAVHPLELAQVKLASDVTPFRYTGGMQALKETWAAAGRAGIYRGFWLGVATASIGNFARVAVIEASGLHDRIAIHHLQEGVARMRQRMRAMMPVSLDGALQEEKDIQPPPPLDLAMMKAQQYGLTLGALCVCDTLLYPVETVRMRLMASAGEAVRYTALFYGKQVLAKEGTAALYRGLPIQLARNVVIAAVFVSTDFLGGTFKFTAEPQAWV